MPVLAIATTLAYFAVVYVLAPLARRLPTSPYGPSACASSTRTADCILRKVLQTCTSRDFKVADVKTVDRGEDPATSSPSRSRSTADAHVADLAADLNEIDGVHAVSAGDVNEIFDA